MILDTSFLIDVLRGNDAVTEWERELDERGVGVVTAISIMELWEGVHLADATDEERNEPILTGNPDHFERLDDVGVESY